MVPQFFCNPTLNTPIFLSPDFIVVPILSDCSIKVTCLKDQEQYVKSHCLMTVVLFQENDRWGVKSHLTEKNVGAGAEQPAILLQIYRNYNLTGQTMPGKVAKKRNEHT